MEVNLQRASFDEQQMASFPLFAGGEKKGSFRQEEILEMFSSGRIDSSAMVKTGGVWVPLSETGWLAKATAEPGFPPAAEAGAPSNETEPEEKQVTCPHCWHQFGMSQINFISRHVELIGDPILGPEAQSRFLPTSFNEQGYAIDASGMVCPEMACPNCHLRIPEAVIDLPSSLFSIVGAPASGKSYYLTAMAWRMRNILARQFDYTLADTDETFNSVLNSYESILFLNQREDEYVALPKTELQGNDFSHQITLKGMNVDLPLPFIFTLTPLASNHSYSDPLDGMRNIIFYDNAGEHFEPGRDQVTNLAARHLIHSDGILFLYDPIKDSRMASQCNPDDPQVARIGRGANQLVLLNEMISRIRKYAGLRSKEKYDKPLVVIIPKYDAWKSAFPIDLEHTEFVYYSKSRMNYYLDMTAVTSVSFVTREELMRISPDVVATCEAFFSIVYFIPVSALGRIPEYDSEKDMIAIKPQHLSPIWAEVPMLLQFWLAGLVDAVAPEVPGSVPIEQYRFSGSSLVYTLPGSRERESVPQNYWGNTVYSRKLGKYIQFPSAPEAMTEQAMNPDSDDFWKQ